jgi:hypothetical protein
MKNMLNRPSYSDLSVIFKALRNLAPRVTQLTKGLSRNEEIEKELADALQRTAPSFDADDIAEYLEKRYLWSCSEELIDVFFGVQLEVFEARAQAVADWIEANEIKPRKSIGDTVEVQPLPIDFPDCCPTGKIIGIDAVYGTYKVFIPSRHVMNEFGIKWTIIPFEDLDELKMPPEQLKLTL